MSEIVILPEMMVAGIEAMVECRKAGLSDHQTALAIYMAMEAVREMAFMGDPETIH